MKPGLMGWLLLPGFSPGVATQMMVDEAGAGEPCGCHNITTGHQPLTELAQAWFLASDCSGEQTLELVVVWRGDTPNWQGSLSGNTRAPGADGDEVMAMSLAEAHQMTEESHRWGQEVVMSLCPTFGVAQTSALRGYLWGTVTCADTKRWYLVHATEREQYMIIGHVDVSMTGGGVPVLYVDVDTEGARIVGREVREAKRADDLVPDAQTMQAIRGGQMWLDRRGVLTTFLGETALAREFLAPSPDRN